MMLMKKSGIFPCFVSLFFFFFFFTDENYTYTLEIGGAGKGASKIGPRRSGEKKKA
jgi:hypothetical protein